MRQLGLLDMLLCEVDTALRTLVVPKKRHSSRANPAEGIAEPELNAKQRQHVAGLMRVNHSGEVCAQALYQGQAMTAKLTAIREQMTAAAMEEIEHLAWCEQRLTELNSHPSILNPLWYSGSFMLGALAGLAGDRYSLGFVAETERQVTNHLQKHLQLLPPEDIKTKAIISKMQEDETQHAEAASAAGAAELPYLIKQLMHGVSKLMTQSSYYL